MRALLTGFGPFPGVAFNPTAVLVEALARRRRPALSAIERTGHVFATVYAAVDRDLPGLFAQKPDVVLMFGLASRTNFLRIEARARNSRSVLFADAGGHRPQRAVIRTGAPTELRTAAPSARLLATARRAGGVAARLSRDAGRYLCNYAYWRALERAGHGRGNGPLVIFVHIPPVRPASRPLQPTRARALSLPRLIAVAEKLLLTLIAASRR